MVPESTQSLEIFFCYAHEDKPFRDELDRHLKALKDLGLIRSWYDGEIVPGDDWEEVIKDHLNKAQIVLLLISVSFLNSDYIYRIELKRALERHKAGMACVIPVLLRPVYWEGTPISRLQMLPTDAKPITLWPDRDAAFEDVVRGIHRAVNEMLQKQRYSDPILAFQQASQVETRQKSSLMPMDEADAELLPQMGTGTEKVSRRLQIETDPEKKPEPARPPSSRRKISRRAVLIGGLAASLLYVSREMPPVSSATATPTMSRKLTLVLAWKSINDERLFWSRFDGSSWTNPQVAGGGTLHSSAGPGLAALGDKLYLVWRADYSGLFWSRFDGSSWTNPQVVYGTGTDGDPALAVFDGRLYLAWRGVNPDQSIYWTTFNGTSWAPQQQINVHTTHGPALATLDNKLYLVWKGMDTDQNLWWSSFDGNAWADQQEIPDTVTSTGPALAGFGGKLYIFWKGLDTDQTIRWTTFNGTSWAPHQLMRGFTSSVPASAVW